MRFRRRSDSSIGNAITGQMNPPSPSAHQIGNPTKRTKSGHPGLSRRRWVCATGSRANTSAIQIPLPVRCAMRSNRSDDTSPELTQRAR